MLYDEEAKLFVGSAGQDDKRAVVRSFSQCIDDIHAVAVGKPKIDEQALNCVSKTLLGCCNQSWCPLNLERIDCPTKG